jgi:hypothetical protein
MSMSGLYERPRVSGHGSACERFELENGAMTLGWSSEGDVLCILSGACGEGFATPLTHRLTEVLGACGRVRLWLDFFDVESLEEGFHAGLSEWLDTHGARVSDAHAVVTHDVATRAVAGLNAHLGGRIEVLGDAASQAELYARFARGA